MELQRVSVRGVGAARESSAHVIIIEQFESEMGETDVWVGDKHPGVERVDDFVA